ncbi:TnsA endonuclease N-terminal domain-containing protein [Roseateles sp. BYS78W]|uniref:TnsA endonuclease N-terminal domain-containing protein n=1 Tax=Pelomonas candidula TaxID=3299025 RepID=A0ABW7HDR6_9BURK
MRTTKRFTPAVLRRFARQGRGTGIFDAYQAWHQVSRGDPASRGRSHIQLWNGRQHDLLSDGEWVVALFAIMVPGLLDMRAQFPLSLEPGRHELAAYSADYVGAWAPGTRELARRLGIEHPVIRDRSEKADWVPTTDLLLTFTSERGPVLLAISDKPNNDWQNPRQRELLTIEQAYWRAREVEWLLITPNEYCKAVGLTLRRTAQWALGPVVSDKDLRFAVAAAHKLQFRSERLVLETLAQLLGDLGRAQRALWQSIWTGRLPVDLDRGWRNHLPLRHVDLTAFHAQNPIVSRRSAWN